MKRTSKFLLLISIAALVAGCKLAVIVVEGGTVESTGSGICVAGSICIVDVTDPNFSETFKAVRHADWYFQKWNSGDRFFCGGSTDPTCTLSFQGYEDSKAVEAMIASSETFYLMPVFKPYKDVIRVDGKQWLQPDLFEELTWEQIDVVCPGGTCINDGKLNGYDMTGWTWASAGELNSVFNYYLGAELLGPGPSEYTWSEGEDNPPPNPAFGNDFYSDGWRATDERSIEDDHPQNNPNYARHISGWVSDKGAQSHILAFFAYLVFPWGTVSQISTSPAVDGPVPDGPGPGAWFYRAL